MRMLLSFQRPPSLAERGFLLEETDPAVRPWAHLGPTGEYSAARGARAATSSPRVDA